MGNRQQRVLAFVYRWLMDRYGPQGWWPLVACDGVNPTKTGATKGYHPGDYTYPRTDDQRVEICVGAILTQNTAWTNVEKALGNLQRAGRLSLSALAATPVEELRELIRPAGYYNQKAAYLQNLVAFLMAHEPGDITREALLTCKGVGNETADSILLYAFSRPEFVIDAYTKRIFLALGLCDERSSYMSMKQQVESAISPDVVVYQEYHALLVEHAKQHYNKKPFGIGDPLINIVKALK
ncbi:MAG: endonuclease III domain-containing protein [Myxococcales bacterium]|jgi:endonuclease-3 related protein|nr:endonuclease III domain-containing protein [Myxococcales bacterium]